MAAYDFVCPKCGAQPMESCRSVTKIGAPYIGRPHAERPRCKADLGPAIAVRRRPGPAKATAPRGRVTLDQAAMLSDLSRATVHRRCVGGAVPYRTEPDGAITIARRDVKLLQPQPRAPGGPDDAGRKPVQLRPSIERYAAWERAAGDQPVSVWLGELADRAAEYSGED